MSIRSWFATTLRTSPSMMSSSRLCALCSSRKRLKNLTGSEIRQRANTSIQMYFLSRVGIWLDDPSHSNQRLSKLWMSCTNGVFQCRPGVFTVLETILPNCVTITCSFSATVNIEACRTNSANKAAIKAMSCARVMACLPSCRTAAAHP